MVRESLFHCQADARIRMAASDDLRRVSGGRLRGLAPRGKGLHGEAGAGSLDLGPLREGRTSEEVRAGDRAEGPKEGTSVQVIFSCGVAFFRRAS